MVDQTPKRANFRYKESSFPNQDLPSDFPRTQDVLFFMPQKDFTITNQLGIHARPAAQFVKIANGFPCDIRVEKDDDEVDGKSILGLMMLAAGHGSVISVSTDGEQAEEALTALGELIARDFEEAVTS